MTVVAFPIKKMSDIGSGPCRVVFHSASFKNESGIEKTVNISVNVEDGDFQGIIDVVIETGGIWGKEPDGLAFFLPWPCACVEIYQA